MSGGAILRYENDGMAVLSWNIAAETVEETVIVGTQGRIKICTPSHCPTRVTIMTKDFGRGDCVWDYALLSILDNCTCALYDRKWRRRDG